MKKIIVTLTWLVVATSCQHSMNKITISGDAHTLSSLKVNVAFIGSQRITTLKTVFNKGEYYDYAPEYEVLRYEFYVSYNDSLFYFFGSDNKEKAFGFNGSVYRFHFLSENDIVYMDYAIGAESDFARRILYPKDSIENHLPAGKMESFFKTDIP